MLKKDDELRIIRNADGEMRIRRGIVLKYDGCAEEIKLPDDIVRIAPYAFAECTHLRKLVTSVKLSSIGRGAFYGCDRLTEVTLPGRLYRRVNGGKVFPENNDIYFRFYATSGEPSEDEDYSDIYESEADYRASGVDDGTVFNNDTDVDIITIEEDLPVEDEPEDAIDGGEADEPETLREKMEAVIPADEEGGDGKKHELVNLGDYLIEGDTVIKYIGTAKETRVPDFIKTIGDGAFSNTEVEAVFLPQGLEIISKNAFSWCVKLGNITFPDTLQMIDDGAFSDCESLKEIKLNEGLKFIGANAFRACSGATALTIPASVQNISRRAFDFCVLLESAEIPAGITCLHEGVFSHCEALRRVALPEGLKEISAWAFAECCELREINIPSTVEDLREVAFLNCRSLIAIDLPFGLKSIGRQAFTGCNSLHLVNMPKRLEKQIRPTKCFHKLPNLQINFIEEDVPPQI